MARTNGYNADSITRFEGLDGIRAKPGMYVGDIDARGILHLMKEIVGNSIDEAMNGHGSEIAISVKGGVITVFDRGRGIPTGPHKTNPKLDTLTIILTELHSGGKLKNAAANYSAGAIGTHGVGMAVVNALSTKMTVYTKSSGAWQEQTFSKGRAASKVQKAGKVPTFAGKKWPSGTVVQFTPDLTIFEKGSKLTTKMVLEWVQQISWFVYGPKAKPIKFLLELDGKTVTIERKSLGSYGPYTAKKQQLEALVDGLPPFVFSSPGCDVMLYPTTGDKVLMRSSVSAVETIGGGTHVNVMRKEINAVLESYRTRSSKFTLDDFLTGVVVVCNVKLVEASFAGQSKERLTTKVDDKFKGLGEALKKWCRKHREAMQTIIQRAAELGTLNVSAALQRKLASALKKRKNGKSLLPTSLIQSTTKDRDERELFLVEGTSAGGSAQKASDRRFQEILLLRGKVLNVVKDEKKVNKSQVIVDILKAIGYDPKKEIGKSRRVGKIYLLTDPDPDGSHIGALLMGLLYSTVPQLFAEGRVYDITAPLYSYTSSKVKAFGNSLAELQSAVGKGFNSDHVVRMKGWGEATANQLKPIAFDRSTRRAVRIDTSKAAETNKALKAMLGEGTEMRRQLLGIDV